MQLNTYEMNYNISLPENDMKGMVLGIHGFGSSGRGKTLMQLGSELRLQGYGLLTFDLPSHGINKSNVLSSLDECIEAVDNAVSYAKSFGKPLSVFATSFGAYLTLLYMAKNKYEFERIVLRAPAVYMDEVFCGLLDERAYSKDSDVWQMGHDDYPIFVEKQFLSQLEKNRLENFDFPSCATLVIQGQQDNVVDWKKNAVFFDNKFGGNVRFEYMPTTYHFFRTEEE